MNRERVFDISIGDVSFDSAATWKGSFILDYHIGLFNACADLDHTAKTSMKVNFSISVADAVQVCLTGEYIPEREPDDM